MKVKFNKKSNILNFGKYGQLHMQKGSAFNHKTNGLLDIDVISALMTYIAEMNQNEKSRYNLLALNNLQSAYVFLRLRRFTSYALKNKKDKKNEKETKK